VLAAHPEVPQVAVDYRQLTSSPQEVVHQVYQALGIELGAEYDGWLQAQAEREKKHHSKFEYSLGEYEVSSERIEAELVSFYEQYQWPKRGSS
jgi:hypothetical protein